LKVTKLIIHHSLTKDGTAKDWDAIRRYHMQEKGWTDIGYHWGVENVNGAIVILRGRLENVPGAHTIGMNQKSLGICVVGNYDLGPPSDAVLNRLADLCALKCKEYHLRPEDIEPHSKYASYKTCPGTKFPMDKLREKVRAIMAGGERRD
jgi:N-acetylmuramoyl-L-alanine amidase